MGPVEAISRGSLFWHFSVYICLHTNIVINMKDYLLKLLEACAPENAFAQDAIEHAIFNDNIALTYDLEADTQKIMAQYDDIILSFRLVQAGSI